MIKNCLQCETKLIKKSKETLTNWNKRKFCSLKCFWKYSKGKTLLHLRGKNASHWKGGPVKKICPICGKEFWVKKSRESRSRFCSQKCKYNAMKEQIPWNKGTKGLVKPNSGNFKKGFTPWNKNIKGLIPWNKNKKGQQVAWNKNKKFKQITGNNHWNWKDGITPENIKIRNSLEMKLWRKSCFERDNFTCQKTGDWGGELVVHHINNFADFPELRTSIENGITLNKKVHKEFHKKYGYKNNTKEQLKELKYAPN